MIKEYYFPNLFENVVGEVIPQYVLEHMKHPFVHHQRTISDQESIQFSSSSRSSSSNNHLLVLKAKQKKILRRSECTKTSFIHAFRESQHNKENEDSQENGDSGIGSPRFANFLRRRTNKYQKYASKSSRSKENTDEIENTERNSQMNKQSQIQIDFSQPSSPCYQQQEQQHIRNFYRVRTSIDRPIFLDGIAEQAEQDIMFTMPQPTEGNCQTSGKMVDPKKMEGSAEGLLDVNTIGKGSTKRSLQRSQSNILHLNSGEAKSSIIKQRRRQKKKTVNFVDHRSTTSRNVTSYRNPNRKDTNISNYSGQSKISKLSKQSSIKNSSLLKRFNSKKQKSVQISQYSESLWTGKSVVSIKFDGDEISDEQIQRRNNRQNSIRSKASILDSQRNLKFKRNLTKTRTAKFIMTHQGLAGPKEYKSEPKIKDQSRSMTIQPKKNRKFTHKVKKLNSQSNKDDPSEAKKMKLRKVASQRASLFRRVEPFAISESSIRRLNTCANLVSSNELPGRRKCQNGLNKTQLRTSIIKENAFDELNKFLKFISEKEDLTSQRQIKPNFQKPIVIPEEIGHWQVSQRGELFNKQNLFIDMGLKLTKRMNKLSQVKY